MSRSFVYHLCSTPSLLPSRREQAGEGWRDTESTRATLSHLIAATWLSPGWGANWIQTTAAWHWVLVIAHWMRCSITYEIRTCRRFSQDWPIDRSPKFNLYLTLLSSKFEVPGSNIGQVEVACRMLDVHTMALYPGLTLRVQLRHCKTVTGGSGQN